MKRAQPPFARPFAIPFALTAALAAVLAAGPAAAKCQFQPLAELPIVMQGRTPLAEAKINGAPVRFILDSGAFYSMLSPEAAKAHGLKVTATPYHNVGGVGGRTQIGVTVIKTFTFAGTNYPSVEFTVGGHGFGDENVGLLGENVLGREDVEYDLANGRVRMFHSEGCLGVDLDYWTKGDQGSVIQITPNTADRSHIIGTVKINGEEVRAMFDTGAPSSYVGIETARRLGFRPEAPGVVPAGSIGGVGTGYADSWIAPFESFAIGREQVRNTRLRVADIGGIDMLIGADFFLSHRILVANSQHKLYFSYNGGPVFNLETAGGDPLPPRRQTALPDAPLADAGAYMRRGAASLGRKDVRAALADLDKALALEPDNVEALRIRATAHVEAHEDAAAAADLDHALRLKPNDTAALKLRAARHAAAHEDDKAEADLKAAREASPTDTDFEIEAADIFAQEQRFAHAIPWLDRWLERNPKDRHRAQVLNSRCYDRALWGRELDLALADCEAALKLEPGDPSVLDSRGTVRLRQGRFALAIADYDAALRKRPKSAPSLYGRGLAKLKYGALAEGRADIAAAIAVDPKIQTWAQKNDLTEDHAVAGRGS